VSKSTAEENFCDESGRAPLLTTPVSTWATSAKGTEWLVFIQLAGKHGRGQINYFFTCWTYNIE
jgi:hypothetical protein